MKRERFAQLAEHYPRLRLAVVGDFCLDRYLEIDPAREETSIETGLPVHNVTRVRSSPGAAGTVLNNLVALGIGEIFAVGFAGEDGEGFELRRALADCPGVNLEHFLTTAKRHTFTYCKPLVVQPGEPPVELNRIDVKNWSATPADVEAELVAALGHIAGEVDAILVMDQVDLAGTGVVTQGLLAALAEAVAARPNLLVLADSRRGLGDYPSFGFKMNALELAAMTGAQPPVPRERVCELAAEMAANNRQPVFVTLAEEGIVGALADGQVQHVPALPVRGPIDIVGAGDSVTPNLAAAIAAGASLTEAIEIAMAAASHVIHQLGCTGTAGVEQIRDLLPPQD